MFIIESTADQTPITIIQVLPSQHMSVAILAQGFILAPVEAQACPCRSRINEQQTYRCLHGRIWGFHEDGAPGEPQWVLAARHLLFYFYLFSFLLFLIFFIEVQGMTWTRDDLNTVFEHLLMNMFTNMCMNMFMTTWVCVYMCMDNNVHEQHSE